MNRFSDAVAHEQLDSDEEDLGAFTEPPKRKRTGRASNISGRAAPPTLSLSNSFETLLVEESSDDEDGSFQSESGSESSENSGDESTPEIEPISNDEVQVQLFSHDFVLTQYCCSSPMLCQGRQSWTSAVVAARNFKRRPHTNTRLLRLSPGPQLPPQNVLGSR
jgi:hypothetical protein